MASASRELLGPSGPLARALPGYEERAGQLDMAEAVERALAGGRTLLCEAGTGTGKTLAYLVPAILSGRKVVVSTATKALQEQIMHKDLPLIHEHLGLDAKAALAKGLSNYLCLRRYSEVRSTAGLDPQILRALPLIEKWVDETETGDVAELPTLTEADPVFREISSSSETRIGASCAFYDRCFVTRMRRDLDTARIIVANHHLVFADLAVKAAAETRGYGAVGALPPYDAIIFDEAHELENIATEFFGTRVSRARIASLLRDADRAGAVGGGAPKKRPAKRQSTAVTAVVERASEELFELLAPFANGAEGRVTMNPEIWSGPVAGAYHKLDESLEALAGWAEVQSKDEAMRMAAQRATQLRADLTRIADPSTNHVTWIEASARSVSVGASPVELGGMFRDRLIERIGSIVFTSATLTTPATPVRRSIDDIDYEIVPPSKRESSFGFFRARVGLDDPGAVSVPIDELSVLSPFDFKRTAMLYTPRDLPEVTAPDFIDRAASRVAELCALTGGGAFVLCTSVRSMRGFATALRGRTPRPPLLQGDAPKLQLLRRFRADGNAVLCATMSFWEGVDVPGDALRLVVIDRIPFSVPTDPVVMARCRAIEGSGGNPFIEYSVPEAAITLKQGFGRLIRTRTDRGIVAILDRRIRTRGYGPQLLGGLPPARRTDRLDDVSAFWLDPPKP